MDETHTLTNDDGRDVRLKGALLGEDSSYSAANPSTTRWTEVRIYQTRGGSYVAQVVARTQWQGERNYHQIVKARNVGELVAGLERLNDGRLGRVSKGALEEAGLDCAETIE